MVEVAPITGLMRLPRQDSWIRHKLAVGKLFEVGVEIQNCSQMTFPGQRSVGYKG